MTRRILWYISGASWENILSNHSDASHKKKILSRMSIEEITLSQLKASGRKLMSQRDWNSSSLISLGGQLASEVNSVTSLSGPQKQTLVVLAVKELVKESVKGSSAELAKAQQLLQIADDILPACLNLAVSAARGSLDLKKIDLKKVQTTCWAFLPSLLSCCASKEQIAQIAKVADLPSNDASKTLTVENIVLAVKEVVEPVVAEENKSESIKSEEVKTEEVKTEEVKTEEVKVEEKQEVPEAVTQESSNPSLTIRIVE